MDVMMPKVICVNDAYYRVNHKQTTHYDEDPEDFIKGEDNDIESEEMMSSTPIEECDGKLRAFLDIPSELYGHLIGRKGASLRMVQDNTGCKVTIPRGPRNKSTAVEVVGRQRRDVVRACNMLSMSADHGRRRLRPSHFVALRLSTQHVQNRLETFKVEVDRVAGGARGLLPALFQEGPRLHLTLAMLTLLSETERNTVCRAFENAGDELRSLLPPGGLSVRLRGLDIMNDDEAETRVLYARARDSDGGATVVQALADRCHQIAAGTGLAAPDERASVKLHCTLMNAGFLTRHLDESDPRYAELRGATFDASAIKRELAEFDFGTVHVERLEMVQRQSYGDDGFYLVIGSVPLRQQ